MKISQSLIKAYRRYLYTLKNCITFLASLELSKKADSTTNLFNWLAGVQNRCCFCVSKHFIISGFLKRSSIRAIWAGATIQLNKRFGVMQPFGHLVCFSYQTSSSSSDDGDTRRCSQPSKNQSGSPRPMHAPKGSVSGSHRIRSDSIESSRTQEMMVVPLNDRRHSQDMERNASMRTVPVTRQPSAGCEYFFQIKCLDSNVKYNPYLLLPLAIGQPEVC